MNIPVNDENQWLEDADIWAQNGTTVGFILITFIFSLFMRVPLSIFISFYLGHDFKRVCVFFVISLYNFFYFSQQISLLRRETWNIRTDDRATINLEADFRSSNESFDIEYRGNS